LRQAWDWNIEKENYIPFVYIHGNIQYDMHINSGGVQKWFTTPICLQPLETKVLGYVGK
jgi:hypothetical protein